ncbi:phospholipase A2 [Streptomyces sp. NPDC002033]|uniref:phospholipase A2 n=1 Tax=unclassified Streptomyces TaxID=2593676 RepID=UPI00331EE318
MGSLFRERGRDGDTGVRRGPAGVRGRARTACLLLAVVMGVGGAAAVVNRGGSWGGGGKAGGDTVAVAAADASANHVDSLLSVGKEVYALEQGGTGVYRATMQDSWVRVGDAQKIVGGGAGMFAMLPGSGDIARYTDDGKWEPVGGPGAEFAVTNSALYGLSPDGTSVHRWTRETGWGQLDRTVEHLYGGGAGLFGVLPGSKEIARYTDGGTWETLGGPGAEFAVTDSALYRLSPDRATIDEWMPEKGWQPVGGPAEHIFGGRSSVLMTAQGSGDVSRFATLGARKWEAVGGPGAAFTSTPSGTVYGIWPDGSGVSRRSAEGDWLGTAALRDTGPVLSAEQKVRRIHELTEPGDEATRAWLLARSSHGKGEPDPYGFRWDENGCNVIGDSLHVVGFEFKSACARHDFGYRNYRDALGEDGFRGGVLGVTGGGVDSPKNRVDQVFRQDLLRSCDAGHYPAPKLPAIDWACRQTAEKVYAAVVVGG